MKSLKQYISEANSDSGVSLSRVIVAFKFPSNLAVEVPISYDDDDIQIYLEDTLLSKLPGGEEADYSELFGDNIQNITDAYLTWDDTSVSEDDVDADIEWNRYYDSSKNSDEMKVVNIITLSYILEFSKFTIFDVEDKTEAIDKLCEIMEHVVTSNNENKELPVLTFDKKDIKYS